MTTETMKPQRMMVLTLTVDPKDWDFVKAAVSALRSGLVAPDRSDMREYARSYYGPFEVDDLDGAIVSAIADYCDGIDEGPLSDREPSIVEGRAIRLAARQLASIIRGQSGLRSTATSVIEGPAALAGERAAGAGEKPD